TERDEKLAAVRVRPGVRHREDACFGVTNLGMKLVGELVARSAGPLTETIAALNHEAVDDAVKDHAVVERRFLAFAGDRVAPLFGAFSKADEVLHGVGRFPVEQADLEIAFGCREIRVNGHVSSPRIVPPTKIFVDNYETVRRY